VCVTHEIDVSNLTSPSVGITNTSQREREREMGSSQSYIWIPKGEESKKYHKVFKNVRNVFGGVKAPIRMSGDEKEPFTYSYSDLSKEKFIGSMQSCNHPS